MVTGRPASHPPPGRSRQGGRRRGSRSRAAAAPGWTFFSNHGHVLLCLAREPGVRLREVAGRVGITERAVQRIVAELEQAGHLVRWRRGRRNRYRLQTGLRLRHPIEAHCRVGELIQFVLRTRVAPAAGATAPHRRGAAGLRKPGNLG